MSQFPLNKEREKYQPLLPFVLQKLNCLSIREGEEKEVEESIKDLFPKSCKHPLLHFIEGKPLKVDLPLKVGVLFSGGQAPGGHNVIWGLLEGLKQFHEDSKLIGFLKGPYGLIEGSYEEITEERMQSYRNTGGFDLIGSGRTKIESREQFRQAMQTVQSLNLTGLVIIGGDDSNTNAANLAEYFLVHNCSTKVVGVPKTIDGDLKSDSIEISFGFDTACKVYSEMIGNIARDALSAKKYYHFVKLMGRSASHVTLECALQVHPNYTLIGEEVSQGKMRLKEIVEEIASLIVERSSLGKNYGIILIPEGLVEFVFEMKQLIGELNAALAQSRNVDVMERLSKEAKQTYLTLPEKIQKQLLMERDPHGNVQVSMIATEELLIEMVKEELLKRKDYKGKFSALPHFFGYEGRASFPSNFDANYTFALGKVASALIVHGKSGYMAQVYNLKQPVEKWQAGGIPIISMMQMEERKGKMVPVIVKSLVDLKGEAFSFFAKQRESWQMADDYNYSGPIQFFGPSTICDATTITLQLER